MKYEERTKLAQDIMCLSDSDKGSALCYLLGYASKGDVSLDEAILKLHEKLSFGVCVGEITFDYRK